MSSELPSVKLSVVIPTHNRKALLQGMLQALSKQSFPTQEFETIVVVDGSSDATQEMLQGLQTPYSLRYLNQPQSGVAAARNHGAREAQGRLLVFLDDDLIPHPRLLEEHVRMQSQVPPGVMLGRLYPPATGKRRGWNTWEERVYEKHFAALKSGDRPPSGRRLYSGNFSIPRESFIKCGGFDESLERGEDVELGFRLEKAGVPFYYNPEASVIHLGRRSFASWCNSSYLYGRTDVLLAVKSGHINVLPEVFSWYHRKQRMIRWMIGLCLDRRKTRSALLQALRAGSEVVNALRLAGVAHGGYSTIFNLNYWQGVSDELGGKPIFKQHVERWRPQTASVRAPRPWHKSFWTRSRGSTPLGLDRRVLGLKAKDRPYDRCGDQYVEKE